MGDNDLTTRDDEKLFDRATSQTHRLVLIPRPSYLLEVHDVHFHHNSAVMLPDAFAEDPEPGGAPLEDDPGLAVLSSALRYANEHPTQKLLLAGHTDTSGEFGYNETLSRKRAKSVLHLIEGSDAAREQWRKLANETDKTEDVQLILKFIARDLFPEWGCDPGAIDDVSGPSTRAAIRAMQTGYKRDFLGPDGIEKNGTREFAVDGEVGPQTWGAIFDVYQHGIRTLLDADEARMAELHASLAFVDDGKRAVGCGEFFPIEEPERQNFKSRRNRRVEILFFEPEHLPLLDCHPSADGNCVKELCEVYNPRAFFRIFIPVTPGSLDEIWRVRVLRPGRGPIGSWPKVANKPFVLRRQQAGPDAEINGTTNADGELVVRVFADDEEMTLEIDGVTLTLRGGKLPALSAGDEASIKHRLFNVGHGPPQVDRWTPEQFRTARRAFKKRELGVDDDAIDAPLVDKLREVHGG